MALDKLTKIDGGGISTTSDYRVGVITATKFVGPFEGTITSTDANFTGNVSIAGTLTYEDVTNIDSVGIITARDGIFIPDNKKLELGNASGSGDLSIYHDGSHSYIDDGGTGNLYIQSNHVNIDSKNGEQFIDCLQNGAVELYFNNNKRFTSSNYGADLFGQSTAAQLRFKTQEGTNRGMIGVTNANVISILDAQDHSILVGRKDGAVELYHDNSIRISTTSTGVQVNNGSADINLRSGTSSATGQGQLTFENVDGNGNPRDVVKIIGATSGNGGYGKLRLQTAFNNTLNTRLTITQSGHVGIGTDNPSHELDIESTSPVIEMKDNDAGDSRFQIAQSGAQTYLDMDVGNLGSSSLRFRFAGQEKVRFTNGGRVGIGTAPSTYGFHVLSGSSAVARFEREGGENWAKVDIKAGTSSGNSYLTFSDSDASEVGEINYEHGDDSLRISVNSSERLRIDSNGDLGINVNNPTEKLHVDGNIKLTAQLMQSMPADFWSQSNTFIELNGIGNLTHMGGFETNLTSNGYRDSNAQWVSYSANSQSGAAQIGLTPTGYIKFRTDYSKSNGTAHNPTDRVTIDPYGRVLIGGSSAIIGSSSEFNEIVLTGKTRGAGITLQDVDANTRFQIRTDDNGDGTLLNASTNHPLVIRTNNTERLRIAADGKVGINSATPFGMFDVVTDFGLDDNLYKVGTQYRSGNNASGYTASGLQIVSSANNSNGEKNTAYLSFSNRDPALNGSHGSSAFITMTTPDSPGTYGTGQFDFYCRNGAPYAFPNDPQAASNYWMDSLLTIKSNHKIGINSTSPQAALDVTHNDGAYIKSVTNGTGAKVRFSDNAAENFTQIGTIEYKHQNNVIINGMEEAFRFAGTEGTMGVQIEGLLKVTAQPCAVVYQCTGPAGGAANAASDNQEPLHFDHVHINQGGMTISQNNGRIQVPVAGIYFASYMVSGTVTNVDDNDGIELVLLVNGNEYPATNSGAEPVFNFGLTANEEEFFCNNTILVSLSKDDYVEVALDNIGNSDANINRGNFNLMLMS